MAFYYVKNGGTATGDAGRYASQQTGSFAGLGASGYYDNITDAIAATTSPVAGDFINFSDLHAFTQTGGIALTGVAKTTFFVVAVSDTAIDAKRGAGNFGSEEASAGAADIILNDMYISGLEIKPDGDLVFQTSVTLSDCKLTIPNSGGRAVLIAADNVDVTLENSEVAVNNTAAVALQVNQGGVFHMFGGSVTTSTGGVTNFLSGGFGNGGGTLDVVGADLSAITGTLIANAGGSANGDDIINIKFDMCKLDSAVAFTNEDFSSEGHRALFTRCSDVSADTEFQYHLTALGGVVDDDSTIRRGDDPEFEDSGKDISYKIVTNADATLSSPLWFDFPNARWSALSAGATDTLRFYVATTSTLTDKDIYVCITYPDGTNKQTPNFFCSAPTNDGGTLDLMATGSTLATDSTSDWRGGGSALTGHTEYQIDVTTTGDVGADTVANVRIYVTKPSITIQLASIYDLN